MADWEVLARLPHRLHQRLRARHATRHPVAAPANVAHQASLSLLDHVALLITARVGTMWCALAFAGIGIGSLVGVFTNSAVLAAVCGAVSSYFLQLVLLPIIMVGQNLQSRQAEAKAEADHALAQRTAEQVADILACLAARLPPHVAPVKKKPAPRKASTV